MGKALVIVESPAKAKTINKYLGKDFVVKSSVGHVRYRDWETRKRSEEHTSELQSPLIISYAVFCLKKKKK